MLPLLQCSTSTVAHIVASLFTKMLPRSQTGVSSHLQTLSTQLKNSEKTIQSKFKMLSTLLTIKPKSNMLCTVLTLKCQGALHGPCKLWDAGGVSSLCPHAPQGWAHFSPILMISISMITFLISISMITFLVQTTSAQSGRLGGNATSGTRAATLPNFSRSTSTDGLFYNIHNPYDTSNISDRWMGSVPIADW